MKFHEIIALAAGVLWFAFWSVRLFMADDVGGLDALMTLTIVILPLALAWLAIGIWQVRRALAESEEDRHAMAEALERIEVAVGRSLRRTDGVPEATSPDAGVRDALDHLIDLQARGEARIAGQITELASRMRSVEADRPAAPAPAPMPLQPVETPDREAPDAEPELNLVTEDTPGDEALTLADFIRALDFPVDADDEEGFRALRRALRDRRAAQLVTAAQDVLTLLSQSGIYMDDFQPLVAPPRTWRLFAGGERGHAVAAIGGIRDREALAKVSARMREDTIFRDAAHHFIRLYDNILTELEPVAQDAELASLAETRSARAFMLLGRVAKMFG